MTTPFDNDDENIEEPLNEEELVEGEAAAAGNRTFLLVAGILGGIFILTLLCIGAYALWFQPRQEAARQTQAADAIAQATQLAFAVQETERAANATPTRQPTSTATRAAPTTTPVINLAVTSTPTQLGGVKPDYTKTVEWLIQQSTLEAKTPFATSTALPQTGFAEDVGLPGLLGLAVVLVVVIFLSRRLRTAS